MWNVNPSNDQSRGGFQDRDVGRTSFNRDFGPDFGVDYARFSDTPDVKKDLALKSKIEEQLPLLDLYRESELMVRNGFVILKGTVPDEAVRRRVTEFVKGFPEVVEVINQITVVENLH